MNAPEDRGAPLWAAFAAAASSEEFCSSWLAVQCSLLPDVRAGLLLLRDDAVRSYLPAAVWPDRACDVNYLAKAAQHVVEKGGSVVLGADSAEHEDTEADGVQIAYPVQLDGELHGVVVLDLTLQPPEKLQAIQRHLLWGAGWLEALLRRRQSARDGLALQGWAAYFKLTQSRQILETLDGWIRRKLRCLVWRQCKRVHTRARTLMKRGLPEERAWRSATNQRGPWFNAGASHMNAAFPKSWFDRLGLVSLLDTVRRLQRAT